ncbi:Heat shock protein Hsp90 [Corchorus olitorius]|uniref:Heat shock protein Hsp90 n=1 Tax=Corchorus olitorius TaxID=93759 RepID=A0A1R3K3D6_9ROSI|nr:Heat shock protein Hsp90 [Corchorus olitorius]
MDIDDDVVEIEYSNVQIANKTKIKTTAGQNPDQARVKKHNPSCFLTNLPQSNGGGGRGKYGKLMEQSMEENKEKMQKLGISDLSRKKFKSSPPPKILRKDISSSDGKTQTQLPLRHPSSSWLKPTAPVSSHGERVCDPKTCHKCRNLKSNKKSSKSTAGRDLPPIDNRPCFYIILHPMTPEEASQSLEIPPDFVRNNLPNPIPSKAVLKDHSGDCWNISIISKKRNKTIMKHGWNRFYKDHCIRDKEFLFFRYNGDMSFNVQIFDISGRERKYVSTSRRAHQATPEADEEEEIESLVLANKAKTRVKNCKAAQDFKYNSKFPHFKHCLTKSNVEDPFLLNIPRCFCAHIPQGRADFTLHTSKGKSWEVTSIQNGTSRKFSKDLLINHGTFERSGTKEFMEALAAMIRQFCLGFYLSLLTRLLLTKQHNDNEQYVWFGTLNLVHHISMLPGMKKLAKITLLMKEGKLEYLDKGHLKDLISEFISYPISLWIEKATKEKISNDEDEKDKTYEYDLRAKDSLVSQLNRSTAWVQTLLLVFNKCLQKYVRLVLVGQPKEKESVGGSAQRKKKRET